MKMMTQADDDTAMAARQIVSTLVPRETMKPLMMKSNGTAAVHLLAHLLLIGGLAYLVGAAQGHWLVWPAMFVLGVVLTHLFAPQHECAHFSAFKTRRVNEIVASICGAIILVPEIHFRYEHTNHHSYTNLAGQDSQYIPLPKSMFHYGWYLSGLPYWWSSLSGIAKRSLGQLSEEELGFIPVGERRSVIWEARIHALLYVSLALAMVLGWSAPVWYWLLPMLLGQPVMRFIRMTEHVGRPTLLNLLQNTRSTQVAWGWRFIAWNMNYHCEHHLAPTMPYHALPKLNRLVRDHIPVGRGYPAAHREIWRHVSRPG
jgi:fatty acid desaturase